MIQRTLAQIAEMIIVDNNFTEFAQTAVTGVCIDSRKIAPGNLFVPFKGENADGHKYVEAAIKQGAAAAFWQSDVPNPPLHLPLLMVDNTLTALQELARSYRQELPVKVVGITGSNGKTTTKDITANLLSLKYKVQKTEGNFNNEIGLPLTVLGLDEDTDIAVLEMGMSSRGEIEFLTKLARPSAVIITNIGESHLLDLGSRDGITEAKLEIISGLEQGGLIVYFGDEPLLKNRLTEYHGNGLIKTFGKAETNDLYPTNISQSDLGNLFTVTGREEKFSLPVLGAHNVLNALAAMLVAHYFKVPFSEMNAGFANLKLTQMRTELVGGGNGEKIINDAYNASPTSMNAAVELISNLEGYQKKILVLGDMLELGPQEEEFHFQIGQSLNSQKIDLLFTFGRLGRKIAEGAQTVLPKERIFSFDDKNSLIERLKSQTNDRTLVLVKASRGMRLEEVVTGLQVAKS